MQKTCRKLCFTMTALHLKTRSTHWIPITVTFMNVTLHPVCLPSYTSFYLTLHRWHLFNNYVSASRLADISVQLIKIIFFPCSRVTDVWVTWEKKNEAERKLKKKKTAPESCTTRIAHISRIVIFICLENMSLICLYMWRCVSFVTITHCNATTYNMVMMCEVMMCGHPLLPGRS